MEKFVYATNTSSTASGPPSPAGEGSRKSRFLAIDGCAAVTNTTSGHVDNVRVANYASLPAANIGTSTPTGKINFVDRRAYGNDI